MKKKNKNQTPSWRRGLRRLIKTKRIRLLKLKMKLIFQIFILSIVIIFVGCTATKKSSQPKNKNLAFMYNPSKVRITPQYKIYHTNKNESVLFVKIRTSQLLSKSDNKGGKISKVKISYKLVENNNSYTFVDSSSTYFDIDKTKGAFNVILDVPLNIEFGKKYFLLIKATDVLRNSTNEKYIIVDKISEFSRENFIATFANTYVKVFRNTVSKYDTLDIETAENHSKLFVSYYNINFKASVPPYSLSLTSPNGLTPDSVYQANSILMTFPKRGMYHIQTDTTQKEGITFFNYGNNYPNVKTPTELFLPLVYLTSAKELVRYLELKNNKIAVDKFWLKSAQTANSAKELIRIYYTRVKLANIYFSSYKEGWRTDRGMLYIVFGAPSVIYKSNKLEKWVYGEKNTIMSFTFENKETEFTDNYFVLKRQESYKVSWYKALDTWRSGRVFAIL